MFGSDGLQATECSAVLRLQSDADKKRQKSSRWSLYFKINRSSLSLCLRSCRLLLYGLCFLCLRFNRFNFLHFFETGGGLIIKRYRINLYLMRFLAHTTLHVSLDINALLRKWDYCLYKFNDETGTPIWLPTSRNYWMLFLSSAYLDLVSVYRSLAVIKPL